MRARLLRPVSLLLAGVTMATPAAAAASPAPPAAEREAGVVGRVNGEPVYFEDVERQLGELHSGMGTTQRSAFDVDRLMLRVVNDALLAQEARALGMHEEPPIPERLDQRRREIAMERLEREEIWDRIELTNDEAREAYDKLYQTITFRIVTTDEKEQADELFEQLQQGADFETLAREHSVDLYRGKAGLVENVPRAEIAFDIESVIFGHEPGQIVGPFRTNMGWSTVRIESFEEASAEGFSQLEQRVRKREQYRRADLLRKELAARLRDSLPISIDERAAEIGCERLPDSRLMPQVEDPEAVVARAAGRPITAKAFGAALRDRWKGVRNREAALASRTLVLQRLIDFELMGAEAARRGYGSTPEVERAVRSYRTELLIPRFLDRVLAANLEIPEEDKRAYYEEHRDKYRKLPKVHLGQVTVENNEEAEKVAELLRQGAELSWVARRYSIDGFKAAGGDRGWVVPTVGLGDLQGPVAEAEPGTVLGPVGGPGGYVVYLVSGRRDQGHHSFEAVSGNVTSEVFARKFKERLDDFVRKARERSEIVLYDDLLADLRISGSSVATEPHPTPMDAHRNEER